LFPRILETGSTMGLLMVTEGKRYYLATRLKRNPRGYLVSMLENFFSSSLMPQKIKIHEIVANKCFYRLL